MDDRQAYASAFELVGGMEALECPKESLRIFHLESRAVVPNKVDSLSVLNFRTHINDTRLTLKGELESIRQQVDKDLLEQ